MVRSVSGVGGGHCGGGRRVGSICGRGAAVVQLGDRMWPE